MPNKHKHRHSPSLEELFGETLRTDEATIPAEKLAKPASPSPSCTSPSAGLHAIPPDVVVGAVFAPSVIRTATAHAHVLGSGGFGKVYRTQLPGLPGHVAVKVATSGGRPALMNEARVLRLCGGHPCVVRLLGCCWSDGLDALVYDYLDAGDLEAQLQAPHAHDDAPPPPAGATPTPAAASSSSLFSSPPSALRSPSSASRSARAARAPPPRLGWVRRLSALHQVADALAALHHATPRQVIHRDVKPGNVLLADGGARACLADFGVALCVKSGETDAHDGGRRPATPPAHQQRPPSPLWPAHAQQQHQHHGSGHQGSRSPLAGSPMPGSPLPRSPMPGSPRTPTRGGHAGGGGAAEAVLARLQASGKLAGGAADAGRKGAVVHDHHGGWCGTPGYVDPTYEQCGVLCSASDVYSLGVVMAQVLLSSNEPEEAVRVLRHGVKEQQLHLPPATSDWPRASALFLGRLALRAMDKDRGQRPTAADVAAALKQLLLLGDAAAATAGGTAPPPPPPPPFMASLRPGFKLCLSLSVSAAAAATCSAEGGLGAGGGSGTATRSTGPGALGGGGRGSSFGAAAPPASSCLQPQVQRKQQQQLLITALDLRLAHEGGTLTGSVTVLVPGVTTASGSSGGTCSTGAGASHGASSGLPPTFAAVPISGTFSANTVELVLLSSDSEVGAGEACVAAPSMRGIPLSPGACRFRGEFLAGRLCGTWQQPPAREQHQQQPQLQQRPHPQRQPQQQALPLQAVAYELLSWSEML